MAGYFSESLSPVEYLDAAALITNNKLAHLSYDFNKVMLEHEQRLLDIQIKLFTESGTDEDAQYLLEAEEAETKKASGGILSGIIDTISALFKSIKKFLFGAKIENPQDTVVSEDPKELIEETRKTRKGIAPFIKKVVVVGAVGGATVAGGMAIKKAVDSHNEKKEAEEEKKSEPKKTEIKAENVESTVNELKKEIDETDEVISRLKEVEMTNLTMEQQGFLKRQLSRIGKLGNGMKRTVKELTRPVSAEGKFERNIDRADSKLEKVEDLRIRKAKIEKDLKVLREKRKQNEKAGILRKSQSAKDSARYQQLIDMKNRTNEENAELIKLKKIRDERGDSDIDRSIAKLEASLLATQGAIDKIEGKAGKYASRADSAKVKVDKKEAKNITKSIKKESKRISKEAKKIAKTVDARE